MKRGDAIVRLYGMPYKGSKNAIADWIIHALPDAECFVDLFGGGGAITHCAALSFKYDRVIYNELDTNVYNGFYMAIHGEFKNEKRWISREDFFRLKDTEPYAAMCFSFGNDWRTYCYARELEPWKKALHYARVFKDTSLLEAFGISSDGSRADIKRHKEKYRAAYIAWLKEQNLYISAVDEFERLQSLESLERLERLERLETYNLDYSAVNIPDNAVVYCDIPYKGTNKYNQPFDYERFYNWALSHKQRIFVSEYSMPAGFYEVDFMEKRSTLCATNKSLYTSEKLFCNQPYQSERQMTLF